jgi:membrane protease YdiL (CAAX protease family)
MSLQAKKSENLEHWHAIVPMLVLIALIAGVIAPSYGTVIIGVYQLHPAVIIGLSSAILWSQIAPMQAQKTSSHNLHTHRHVSLFLLLAFVICLETALALVNNRSLDQVLLGTDNTRQDWLWRVVIAPTREELTYRYVLLGYLIRSTSNPKRANILISILFALSHVRAWPSDPSTFIYIFLAFIFSLLLGYIYIARRRIFECIMIHALVNHLG